MKLLLLQGIPSYIIGHNFTQFFQQMAYV